MANWPLLEELHGSIHLVLGLLARAAARSGVAEALRLLTLVADHIHLLLALRHKLCRHRIDHGQLLLGQHEVPDLEHLQILE
eukprot:14555037-Alexandrium_andersonii.AAC.1